MINQAFCFKVLVFIVIVIFTSCAPTSKITMETKAALQNWNAESENVGNVSVIIEDDGIEGSPVLLNANTLIFESKKNDNYDLWTIDPQKQGGITQLTTYDGADRLPCPHPDGKRYVFLSDRSETGYYIGEIGKSTVISLVEVTVPYIGIWTSGDISPDGNTFLYVSGKFIWSYDFSTRVKTQLIQGTDPRWSPDGKKIIFRRITKQIDNLIVSTSIWLMNPDGSEQTEIIQGDSNFSYKGARISPDGKKVLYEKQKVAAGKSVSKTKKNSVTTTTTTTSVLYYHPDIWICNIDGTDHIGITTNPLPDQEGVWLDNQTIVFSSERPQSGRYEDKKWDLWKIKLNL